MKNTFKSALILILFITLGSTNAFAQKYGHINVGNLLELMPETALSDSTLVQYRDSLMNVGMEKAKAFDAKVKLMVGKMQSGEMNRKQEQEVTAELQKEQQEIQGYEQQIMNMVQQRRNQLLSPLLQKMDAAIYELGKEHGYMMIFDTSVPNTVLFAQEGDDLLVPVLKKMGVEITE